jgi:hypothetical protein
MRVRVTRKLAECVDGVDLSRCREGDMIDLTEREAQLIVAEQWAVPARRAADSGPVAGDRRGLDLYQRSQDSDQERRHRERRESPSTHSGYLRD